MNRPLFKPGQLILVGSKSYEVMGVYLGGEKTQSLIGIAAIGMPFTNISGIRTSEVCVPEEVLLHLIGSQGGQLYDVAFPMQKKLNAALKTLKAIQATTASDLNSPLYLGASETLNFIENID